MAAYGDAPKEIMGPVDFLYRLQNWQDSTALVMLAEKSVSTAYEFAEKSRYFITLLTCDLLEKLERRKFPHASRIRTEETASQSPSLLDRFRETYMQDFSFERKLLDSLSAYVDDPSLWIGALMHMPHAETRLSLFLPEDL